MARKQSGNPLAGSPLVTDDFRLIRGIGPVHSHQLHDAGISTYSQLASLLPADLTKKVAGLSVKQIVRQNWIGQAIKLASKATRPKPPGKGKADHSTHQHYENFTIELLLDEKNRMRCTRVAHIQSGDADTWPDWEANQLIDFITRHAKIHVPPKRSEKPRVLTSEPLSLFSDLRETTQSDAEIAKPIIQSPLKSNFTGMLRLQDFRVFATDSDTPIHSLRQDQPYHVRLTLDLANVSAPGDNSLKYKATIKFKQLGGTSRLVAEETNIIEPPEPVTLDIICANTPPGLYRPEACMKLFSEEKDLGLMASLTGELIQVF